MLELMFADYNIEFQIGLSSALHKLILLSPTSSDTMRNFTTGLLSPHSKKEKANRVNLLYFATQGSDLPIEEKRKLTKMRAQFVENVSEWKIVMEVFCELIRVVFGPNSWIASNHDTYINHLKSKEVAWLKN